MRSGPARASKGSRYHVRAAFAAKPFLNLTALARALGWDLSTLRGHVHAGKLVGRRKGHGKVRTPRVHDRGFQAVLGAPGRAGSDTYGLAKSAEAPARQANAGVGVEGAHGAAAT
jgi:hypothetical protein